MVTIRHSSHGQGEENDGSANTLRQGSVCGTGGDGLKAPAIIVSCDPGVHTIPEELLRFTPSETETHKYFFRGTPGEVVLRQIFLHQPLSSEEQQWLAEFRKYCSEQSFAVPPALEPMLLRVLSYNRRKFGEANFYAKSLSHLREIQEWRSMYFPLSDLNADLAADLTRGIVYWVGRDEALRPLLVVRLNRAPKNFPVDRFEALVIFCFEWGLRYLMLPGKVETCTVLVDVRGVPLIQIPVATLKNMTNILTKQYPFRLNKMWIIHDLMFMQTLWNIVKQFLTEVQQEKIAIYRNGMEKDIVKEYPLNQLEQKYGGLRPDITSFYPFPIPAGPFIAGSSELSNENAYKNGWKVCDDKTAFGVMWEGSCRTPIQWATGAEHVFKDLGIDPDTAGLPTGALDAHVLEENRHISVDNLSGGRTGFGSVMSRRLSSVKSSGVTRRFSKKESRHSNSFLGPIAAVLSSSVQRPSDKQLSPCITSAGIQHLTIPSHNYSNASASNVQNNSAQSSIEEATVDHNISTPKEDGQILFSGGSVKCIKGKFSKKLYKILAFQSLH